MCVRIAIASTKEELQDCFQDYSSMLDLEPVYNGSPLQQFPIFTENGFEQLIWGEKKEKLIIHHSKYNLEFDNYRRGVLAITGFFVWKKEKAPAPIGFGDYKDTVKIIPHYIKRKDDKLILLPVVISIDSNSFFIVMHEAKDTLKEYQEKEPIVLFHPEGWLKNLDVITTIFSANDYEIYEVSEKVNQSNYNQLKAIEVVN